MRILFVLAALAALIGVQPAAAQTYKPSVATSDANPQPIKLVCWIAGKYQPCAMGGGGGGTSDASAANQVSQIGLTTSIRDQLGTATSPATGTVNARLGQLVAAVGTPMQQTGGTVAIAGTPTVNFGTIGAASTAANQATLNGLATAIREQIGSAASPPVGSVNARLGQLVTAIGTPMQQAGGTVAITGTPTVNLGTIAGAATAANQATLAGLVDGLEAAAGSPADAAWTGSGTASTVALLKTLASAALDASTPTVNLGTIGTAATAARQDNGNTSLASISGVLAAVAPVATAAPSAGLVLKGGPAILYGVNVAIGAAEGYVLVLNAATIPADGAVTPVRCLRLAANQTAELGFRTAPLLLSAGATVVFSTTGCFTKTGSATAFMSGEAR